MGQKNGTLKTKTAEKSPTEKKFCWKIESICSGRNFFSESTWNDRNCSETWRFVALVDNDVVDVDVWNNLRVLDADPEKSFEQTQCDQTI